jgi:hypothetical protein
LQCRTPGVGGLVVLVQEAFLHQAIDKGHIRKALPELEPAIRPGPQTLAIYDLLEGLGFGFVQVHHDSFLFTINRSMRSMPPG